MGKKGLGLRGRGEKGGKKRRSGYGRQNHYRCPGVCGEFSYADYLNKGSGGKIHLALQNIMSRPQ